MEEFLKVDDNALKFIGILISAILGLLLKDLLGNVAQGISFYLDKSFNEGDRVIINGEKMTINKIGVRKTVFQSVKDGKVVWMYVNNDRIRFMTMSKIIQGEFEAREREE